MKLKHDWKTFLIQNPWFPRRLIYQRFDIQKHDIDNWVRQNPKIRVILDPEKWKIGRDADQDKVIRILSAAWKYYIHNELGLVFDENLYVPDLIGIKNISGNGWGFLTDGHYLSKIAGYEKWIESGLTRTAFALFHTYPGKDKMERFGILPEMFFQTHSKYFQNSNLVDFVEHIYLRHVYGLSQQPTNEDIELAMKVYCARYIENGFFTGKEIRLYGLGASVSQQYIMLSEQLAQRFSVRLGLVSEEDIRWSSSSFRKRFPEQDYTKCRYCGKSPVDLHHLLPRAYFPEHTYTFENVVPICVQVHAVISRNKWTKSEQKVYEDCVVDWLRTFKPEEAGASAIFDELFHTMHKRVYL